MYAQDQWKRFVGDRLWVSWFRVAGWGTAMLVVLFLSYEWLERAYLRHVLTVEELFQLHIVRGVASSVLVASWAFAATWLANKRYENAYVRAYRTLEWEYHERARELERANLFTDRLFHALRDRLYVIDTSGRLVRTNRVGAEACSQGAVGGLTHGACTWHPEECPAARALKTGKPVVGVVRNDPLTHRVFQIDAYPISGAGGGAADVVIEVERDITEAKRLEARLRAADKLAAVGVLTAGIAHDIGNPLASMSSELELLENEDDVAKVRSSLAVVRRHVSRITRTLGEMREFVGRRVSEPRLVPLSVAIDDALRMVRHDPRARRVEVELEMPQAPLEVSIVEDRLVMVFVNLLINALDAMPDGGRLTITARAAGALAEASVRDTGRGIPKEHLQRIFEPLFTTKPNGMGLGLPMSRDALREFGGELSVGSTSARGTTFTLRLPLAHAARAPTEEATAHA